MNNREKEIDEYLQKKRNKEEIIDMLKDAVAIIGIVIWIICAIVVVIYKYSNPQLTSTEITTYSFKYLWANVWFIISYIYLKSKY